MGDTQRRDATHAVTQRGGSAGVLVRALAKFNHRSAPGLAGLGLAGLDQPTRRPVGRLRVRPKLRAGRVKPLFALVADAGRGAATHLLVDAEMVGRTLVAGQPR